MHLCFWISMEVIMAYHGSLYGGTFRDNLIKMMTLFPVHMIAGYALVYWQVPRLLMKDQRTVFFVSFVIVGYLSSVMARLLMIHVAEPLIDYEGIDESLVEIITDPMYLLRSYWVVVYIPAFVLFLIKKSKERFLQQKQIDQILQEKKNAELNFLKAQMNPHFLFNTLNNIYSLSKSQAEDTPSMILKLSDILNYTIYECQAESVPLEKEWELIENYLDLQAVRYHRPLDIRLSYDNKSDVQIAPLILITLVENAFKFASLSNTDIPYIYIKLSVDKDQLCFDIKNSKKDENNISREHKGIGIANVKKQLDLIYPHRHTYTVEKTELTYHTNLLINL